MRKRKVGIEAFMITKDRPAHISKGRLGCKAALRTRPESGRFSGSVRSIPPKSKGKWHWRIGVPFAFGIRGGTGSGFRREGALYGNRKSRHGAGRLDMRGCGRVEGRVHEGSRKREACQGRFRR